MQSKRPVNLNLFTLSYPLAAIVSISHRITGVILFVGIAFGLYALQMALSSPQGFAAAIELIQAPFGRLVMLGLLFVLTFHVVAGIKHLLLDFHIGDSLQAARSGAVVAVVATVVITALLGVALW